jgi:hypothetical protein
MTPTVNDLPRNDVKKAVAFVREKLERVGRVGDDELHTLYQLQDDPSSLVAALLELDAERKKAGLAGLM